MLPVAKAGVKPVSGKADAGLFRNVVPKADEDFVKTNQREAWEKRM